MSTAVSLVVAGALLVVVGLLLLARTGGRPAEAAHPVPAGRGRDWPPRLEPVPAAPAAVLGSVQEVARLAADQATFEAVSVTVQFARPAGGGGPRVVAATRTTLPVARARLADPAGFLARFEVARDVAAAWPELTEGWTVGEWGRPEWGRPGSGQPGPGRPGSGDEVPPGAAPLVRHLLAGHPAGAAAGGLGTGDLAAATTGELAAVAVIRRWEDGLRLTVTALRVAAVAADRPPGSRPVLALAAVKSPLRPEVVDIVAAGLADLLHPAPAGDPGRPEPAPGGDPAAEAMYRIMRDPHLTRPAPEPPAPGPPRPAADGPDRPGR